MCAVNDSIGRIWRTPELTRITAVLLFGAGCFREFGYQLSHLASEPYELTNKVKLNKLSLWRRGPYWTTLRAQQIYFGRMDGLGRNSAHQNQLNGIPTWKLKLPRRLFQNWEGITLSSFLPIHPNALNACRSASKRWLIKRGGNGVHHINRVKLRRTRLVLGLVNDLWRVYHAGNHPGHSGALSLAIPPWAGAMRWSRSRLSLERNGASEVTTLWRFINKFIN